MSEENGRVEHKDLAEALSAFQAEVPVFKKDKTAKVRGKSKQTGAPYEYTYKYADLGDILPIVNPLLAKHGLSWSSKPARGDGEMILRFILRHVSGESDEGAVPLGLGENYDPQDLGAAISYMRRYSMTAQLNIATDEDVDGRVQVSLAAPAPPAPDVASDAQRSQILAAGAEMKMPSSALANVMLLATENDPREWPSEERARSWVANALKQLPAESVEKVIAAIEAPE